MENKLLLEYCFKIFSIYISQKTGSINGHSHAKQNGSLYILMLKCYVLKMLRATGEKLDI